MNFSNNVIDFPNKSHLPVTQEESDAIIHNIRQEYFDQISVEITRQVFDRSMMYGFDVSHESSIKDCVLVVESIKSLLLKSSNIYYPLQDIAEAMQIDGDPMEDFDDDLFVEDELDI